MLSNVTIKTLHHYHKIGLLIPGQVSEAGYRLYGRAELERLQEILFFRELDMSLEQIKRMLDGQSDRLGILLRQEDMIRDRRRRLEAIAHTLSQSITSLKEGKPMENKEMFKGFANEEEWNRALSGQNDYLEEKYGAEPVRVAAADVPELNEQAAEAMTFMSSMAASLREGIKHNDGKIAEAIRCHLEFLNRHGHPSSANDFALQTRFFLSDDFHLKMLEEQQTGLTYYLSAAAEAYANASSDR